MCNRFCQPHFLHKILTLGIEVSPFAARLKNVTHVNDKEFLYYQSYVAHKELIVQLFVKRTNFKVIQTKPPVNVNNKNEAHNVIKTYNICICIIMAKWICQDGFQLSSRMYWRTDNVHWNPYHQFVELYLKIFSVNCKRSRGEHYRSCKKDRWWWWWLNAELSKAQFEMETNKIWFKRTVNKEYWYIRPAAWSA
jgi:hypothetical protein